MRIHYRPQWGLRETDRVMIWETVDIEASVNWMEIDRRFQPFFHLDVHDEWTLRLFRMAKAKFATFIERWSQFPLYTMADEDSDALDRLRGHFGFEYLTDIPCSDGKSRRLFVHYGPKLKKGLNIPNKQ